MATNNVNLKQLDQIDPDITILKQILENSDSKIDPRLIDAIRRKISALTTTPTTIEKTMSQEQLFTSGNPLWTLPYTVHEIKHYLSCYNECTCYADVELLIQEYRKQSKLLKDYMKSMTKYLHNVDYGVIKRS